MAEISVTNMSNTTVLFEKRARRAAEEDAKKLYNRVRQLEKEEQKAQKRIDETRKRAREILSLRQRNEDKPQEKEMQERKTREAIHNQNTIIQEMNNASRKKKSHRQHQILYKKLALAKEVKIEKEENQKIREEEKSQERRRAFEVKESVRKEHEKIRNNQAFLKAKQLQIAQEEYEKRLKDEIKKRIEKERDLTSMAQRELQLIENLKKKEYEQRSAYEELETALGLTREASNLGQSPKTNTNIDPNEPSEEEVQAAFSKFDEEGTGEISLTCLGDLMLALNMRLNSSQLAQAESQLDRSGNGRVSFGEFLIWWKG